MHFKSFIGFFAAFILPALAPAATITLSIPLQNGCVSTSQCVELIASHAILPQSVRNDLRDLDLSVNLRGLDGWVFLRALHAALGPAVDCVVTDSALRITVDSSRLPSDWNQSCDALIRFTQVEAPEASARQARRYGLHLPRAVDPHRPLVVLIHGLDGDAASCADLADLARADGFQTANFCYPAERPVAENAQLLARHMVALGQQFPGVQVELIAESMGSLVARSYVEGPDYAGGVQHLILIAPPNEGSNWISAGWILKLIVNAAEWKNDPQWSPAWMITEGICQESRDLRPESAFLDALNSRPRRRDVSYTIIAGDRPAAFRYEADALSIARALLHTQGSNLWGLRQLDQALQRQRSRLLSRTGATDGPVSVSSARLAGVADFVTLPVDHIALFESVDGRPPAAWPIIRDRLRN